MRRSQTWMLWIWMLTFSIAFEVWGGQKETNRVVHLPQPTSSTVRTNRLSQDSSPTNRPAPNISSTVLSRNPESGAVSSIPLHAPKKHPKGVPAPELQKPIGGLFPTMFRSQRPWLWLSPFAPASMGNGEAFLRRDPYTGRAEGVVLFSIRFGGNRPKPRLSPSKSPSVRPSSQKIKSSSTSKTSVPSSPRSSKEHSSSSK